MAEPINVLAGLALLMVAPDPTDLGLSKAEPAGLAEWAISAQNHRLGDDEAPWLIPIEECQAMAQARNWSQGPFIRTRDEHWFCIELGDGE